MNKEEVFQQLYYRRCHMEMTGIADSYKAFESFFESFSLGDRRGHLWELYERCVMSYHSERTEHAESTTILFFYRQLEMLVDATWLIQIRKAGKRALELEKRKGKLNPADRKPPGFIVAW